MDYVSAPWLQRGPPWPKKVGLFYNWSQVDPEFGEEGRDAEGKVTKA